MGAKAQFAFEPVRARQETPGRFYHPELDVLRFGAFLAVFLQHAFPDSMKSSMAAGFPKPLAALLAGSIRAGGFGVDLFFALSAYLITELLLREHAARGHIDIKAFYLRRILRIWPLYLFALFVAMPLLGWWLPDQHFSGGYLIAFLLFAGNWVSALYGMPHNSFGILWSVSMEEQFYLLWPWALRWGAAGVIRIAGVLLVIATAARLVLLYHGVAHPGIWCNTFARLDPIAGGAWFAAVQFNKPRTFSTLSRMALIGAGAAVIAAVGAFVDHIGWSVLPGYPLVAIATVAILAGTVSPMRPGALSPAMRFGASLGKICFGTYVYHGAVLSLFGIPFLRHVVQMRAAAEAFVVTLAVAAISYRYLESPFLRLKDRFTLVRSRPA